MSIDPNVCAERRHTLANIVAALLANAQFLESMFETSSPEEPLLGDATPEIRRDALIALRHIVESTHALADLVTPR